MGARCCRSAATTTSAWRRIPRWPRRCARALERYGVGSGAAHLVSGHSEAHQRLEQALADFTGRERALLFSTGYMANLGVIRLWLAAAAPVRGPAQPCLAERRCRLAGSAAALSPPRRRRAGAQLGGNGAKAHRTDGVFSMDGDLAPLPELAHIGAPAAAPG
jgi:8-amino-7-oxononanoate synthase